MNLPATLSIYIPRLPVEMTEDTIAHYFKHHKIGEVKRVDFAPIGQKEPGFGKHVDAPFRCAFVHFNFFNNNQYVIGLLQTLESQNGCLHFYYGNATPFIESPPHKYWILTKNHRPIPSTEMNVHQIVENARILENEVKLQRAQIDYLESKLYALEEMIYATRIKNENE